MSVAAARACVRRSQRTHLSGATLFRHALAPRRTRDRDGRADPTGERSRAVRGLYGLTTGEADRDVGSSTASSPHAPMDMNAVEALWFGAMAAQLADVQEQLYVLRSSPSSGWTLEMEGRRSRGECFGCGKVGHRRSECPARR